MYRYTQIYLINANLEDNCEFVIRTSGEEYYMTEPASGVYEYKILANPDGTKEVYKCH